MCSPQPGLRVFRSIVLPDLEIEKWRMVSFALAHSCNRLSSGDALARGHGRSDDVAVERENAIAVIEDDQVSVSLKPLRKKNCSLKHRMDRSAGGRSDFQPVIHRVG